MFFKAVPNPIHGKQHHNIFSQCDSERSKFLEHCYYNKKELESIKAKIEYNIILLKMKLWERRKVKSLNKCKIIQENVLILSEALKSCKEQLVNNDVLEKKYAPLIPGHTSKTLKRSNMGPRTKFQKDCDWLNTELELISEISQASDIKTIDGIYQVSMFAVPKIISLSSNPIKFHAIWLAGWIQEAGFVNKEFNSEHKYFQARYRIPSIDTRNQNYQLNPEWLVSFLPMQRLKSDDKTKIAGYFYKSVIDVDQWMGKLCRISWMSHNIYPVIGEFPEPYSSLIEAEEEKAYRYLEAKWEKNIKKLQNQ